MSVADKLDAARHSLGGSNTALAVCKATSREIMGPKKKHVDYLVSCTLNQQFDVSNLAELLFERCRMSSWVIVSKALITFHNLMSVGDERFLEHLVSRTTLWNLQNFQDKTALTAVTGYDMLAFIRRYSNYLAQKTKSYAEMGYDFCRAKRGPEGVLRALDTPKLLKALAEIQTHLDVLLVVDLQSSEFNNGIINSAFVLLFKDMIRLFACYNDGIINVIENYYTMNKDDCKESLDIYKAFLTRTDNVKQFLKVAQDVGVNENAIPDVVEAPSGLLESLQNHYQSLEKGQVPAPSANSSHPNLAPITVPLVSEQFNFNEKQMEIKGTAEKEETIGQKTLLETAQITQPVSEPVQDSWQTIFEPEEPKETPISSSSNSDDLLQLHDVFQAHQSPTTVFPPQSNFGQTAGPYGAGSSTGFQQVSGFGQTQPDAWGQNVNYTAVNNNNTNPFESNGEFGVISQNYTGGILQPMNKPQAQVEEETKAPPSADDLHSTITKVVNSLDNFDILSRTDATSTSAGHQWTPVKPKVKTGGANFQMGTTLGTTMPPTSPVSPSGSTLPPTSPVSGMATQQQPVLRPGFTQPQMFGVRPAAYGQQPMMRPQANMFAAQNVRSTNPFGNAVPSNQALF